MFNRDDVEKLADLARIKLTEAEAEGLAAELDSILAYVSLIQKAASAAPARVAGDRKNVMREDSEPHESGIYTEALLNQVPQREGAYVKVKKIL
jgi:aspartyl-tRNA(Asn)/glutamyl-tRNA(Gln) amidotransferase subunit C